MFKTFATAVAMALPHTVEAMALPRGSDPIEPAGELAQVGDEEVGDLPLDEFYEQIVTWRDRGRIVLGKWLQYQFSIVSLL